MPHLIREHNVPYALAQAAGLGGNSMFSVRPAGGGEAAAEALSSRQSPNRAVPQQKGTQVLLASQSVLAQSLSGVLDPKGVPPVPSPARELSLTASHSSPGGRAAGSRLPAPAAPAQTTKPFYFVWTSLSGVGCVFRDVSAVGPLPRVCSDSGGEGTEQPPAWSGFRFTVEGEERASR